MIVRICICASQVPFVTGGAELLVESLRAQLVARGFVVDVVALPFAWEPHRQAVRSAFAWRLLTLMEEPSRPIDLVIATKFPSYLIRHPVKVVWMVHPVPAGLRAAGHAVQRLHRFGRRPRHRPDDA